MHSVTIESVVLADVGAFRNLTVSFNPGLNLICGSNGVGKTTLLEVIAAGFNPHSPSAFIRRRAASEIPGKVLITLRTDGEEKKIDAGVSSVRPEEQGHAYGLVNESSSVITLRAARDFSYFRSESINRDPDLNQYEITQRQTNPFSSNEIKQWFANRFLMRPHGDSWPGYRLQNLKTAIEIFGYLDADVSLSHVDTSTFDVFVNTPNGKLAFEYLSSGFRSAYYLLLGIIKEIEFRKLEVSAAEFAGVLLIDELDLHLHPTWQRTISTALKAVFPKAQIIATTHSPHAIQAAASAEVIALVRDETGNTAVRKLPVNRYGFSGWTVEEVLEDVMGMPDTQTPEYRAAVMTFDRALDEEDEVTVASALERLESMLHPSSPMRKIFEIQAAGIGGGVSE